MEIPSGAKGKDCGEVHGVCVGHSFTIFEATSKNRTQGFKKV